MQGSSHETEGNIPQRLCLSSVLSCPAASVIIAQYDSYNSPSLAPVHRSSILQGFPQQELSMPQAQLANDALPHKNSKGILLVFCPMHYLDSFTTLFLKKPPLYLGLAHQLPPATAWSILFSSPHFPSTYCKDCWVFKNSNEKVCFGIKSFLVPGRFLGGVVFVIGLVCGNMAYFKSISNEESAKVKCCCWKPFIHWKVATVISSKNICSIRRTHLFSLKRGT